MNRDRTRIIVEVSLTAALGAALHFFGIALPINIAGGEVSLAMLPIIVLALRRGVGPGVLAGVLVGVLALIYKPFIVHPAQLVFDYPLAFGTVGLAGVFAGVARKAADDERWSTVSAAGIGGAFIGGAARLAAHFVSGIIFFGANAPAGQPVWIYSLVYNASYMLPSIIACAALSALIVPALSRALPLGATEARA